MQNAGASISLKVCMLVKLKSILIHFLSFLLALFCFCLFPGTENKHMLRKKRNKEQKAPSKTLKSLPLRKE